VIVAAVLAALSAVACTTPTAAPGAGGGRLEASCPSNPNWAVGDSLTSGLTDVTGWPDQNPPWAPGSFANKGVGGQAIAWLTYQTGRDLAKCAEDGTPEPDKVVFLGGANDIANAHLSLAAMQEDIQELVALFDTHGIDYRLVSMAPIPQGADWAWGNNQRVNFNNWMAATYPSKFINCDDDLRSGTWLDPAYAKGDRVHLNNAGELVLANCIHDEG
jgi:lysophospholipase L1-like esterase